MKTKWRNQIVAAIIVIVSLWAITLIRSSAYTGTESSADQAVGTSVLSIILLVAAVIYMTSLFHIISKARAGHKTDELASARTTAPPSNELFAAPIVAKVKSHPLPPLWR